uniref:Serpentine receptor class gamma n=1 Tax=Panagrellus redivivus TaxID=6233 RepID=A0A7E4UVG5_PANRE
MHPSNKSQFSSSFFDLTGYIVFLFIFKVPLTPAFGHYFADIQPTYAWSVPYFYYTYAEYVRPTFVLATALNRFTALWFPTKHEVFWKKSIRVTITFSFGIPFLLTWQLLISKIYTIPFNVDSDVAWSFVKKSLDWYFNNHNSLVLCVYYAITGTVTLFINVMCLVKLRIVKNRESKGTDVQRIEAKKALKRAEIGLIVVSCGDTVAMSMIAVIHLILFILEQQQLWYDPLYDTMYLQIPWITDVVRFSRPFLLIFMSKSVRELFFTSFGHAPRFETTATLTSPVSFVAGVPSTTSVKPQTRRAFLK